ncbi:MAG: 4-(cytidine 5'-diphospho)-2-C-methyl-D-erythritol kinase [Acidobacteria bacterium]|nr:4-(cytidine 5'-diphospho)-2-C-methyl-D-erythritol kinase [Acidobacteriota bacterium]MBI3426293.1 4-(cytidine 5'-diphospho)-2-C-methyl-D-erythritol kinase [Acidobacteriota bacterium]
MLLTLPSFAKINWTLEILGKRPDGYHELRTLLQTLSVGDELTFELIEHGIELHSTHPALPLDETNLIYRAARSLAQFTNCHKGVRVTVDKQLPMAAGLGGGSSNAAVTFLALLTLWDLQIEPHELFRLGAQLGADVPFFFIGGTCIGVGRGDEVYPTAEIEAEHLLLVNAGIAVPTREVYGNLPPELTNPGAVTNIPASLRAAYDAMSNRQAPSGRFSPALHNDLENPVLTRHPLLAELKQRLLAHGARGALMSGSGSTFFALFDSEAARATAQQDFIAEGWWCAPARTLNRSAYRQAMQLT